MTDKEDKCLNIQKMNLIYKASTLIREGFKPLHDIDITHSLENINKVLDDLNQQKEQKEEEKYLEQFDNIKNNYINTTGYDENIFNKNIKALLKDLEDSKIVFKDIDTVPEAIKLIQKLCKKYLEDYVVTEEDKKSTLKYTLTIEDKFKILGISSALAMIPWY